MLSFEFLRQDDWAMDHNFYIKEHISMIVKYLTHSV